jgi:hypothetical protein
MGGVIAIDPGKRTGWAVFDATGKLTGAGWSNEHTILDEPPITLDKRDVVIEKPVVYPTRNVPAGDLIDLAVLVGDLRGFYRRHGFEVCLVAPRTWKGTVPKPIHHKRVLDALTPEERASLPTRPRARDFDHNMLDAVGLGLWKLKRI